MNNSTRVLAALSCAALFATGLTGGAQAAPSLPSANGQGILDNGARTFSFSAQQLADGTVTGQAQLTNRSFSGDNGTSPYKLQIDISCMKSFGNTVFFGGMTRRTNDSNLVDAAYFSVQDNGEPGKNDKISRVFFFDDDPTTTGDPALCQHNVMGDFPLETIEKGNIQVR